MSTLLSRLPPQSCEKYLSYAYAQSSAHAALKAAQDRLFDANDRRNQVEQSIAHALSSFAGGQIPSDEREAIQGRLKPAEDAVCIASQAVARATAEYKNYDFFYEVTAWLKRASQFNLKLKYAPLPAVPAGDPVEVVAAIRSELLSLAEERVSVVEAAAPVDDLKAALAEEINRLALEGAPRLDLRQRGVAPIDVRSALRAAVSPGGKVVADNASVFLVWLLRDQLLSNLNTLIDVYAPEQSLSDAEQAAAISKIDKHCSELEWQEEAIITVAASRGQIIPRRREVDPRIFLEVAEK